MPYETLEIRHYKYNNKYRPARPPYRTVRIRRFMKEDKVMDMQGCVWFVQKVDAEHCDYITVYNHTPAFVSKKGD